MRLYTSLAFGLLTLYGATMTLAQSKKTLFYVNDWANVLTDTEARLLEKKIKRYEDSTSTQIAIVLIKSLQGKPIEKQAFEIATDWGIGQKKKNNGVLILAAIGDRKARIEVGKGLVDRISNEEARKTIRYMTRPYFRNKNYYKGLDLAIDRIIMLSQGKFKRYKFTPLFFIAAILFSIWLLFFIIARKFDKPPIAFGIALFGIVLLEIGWMFIHVNHGVSILATLSWLGLVFLLWKMHYDAQEKKLYKKRVQDKLQQLKTKDYSREFIPSQVIAQIATWNADAEKARLKQLKKLYHTLNQVLRQPKSIFLPRPDLELLEIAQKLQQFEPSTLTLSGQASYLTWIQKNLQQELDFFAALDLAKLSETVQERLVKNLRLYQQHYELLWQSSQKTFKDALNNLKYLKTDRQNTQTTIESSWKTIIQTPAAPLSDPQEQEIEQTLKSIEQSKKAPQEIWAYDYLAMLQAMGTLFGLTLGKKLDIALINTKLANKSKMIATLAVWKKLSWIPNHAKREIQKKMSAAYQDWNEAEGEKKLQKLVVFYSRYIETPLSSYYKPTKNTAPRSNSTKTTYTSQPRSSSSYEDDNYSSGNNGSPSWGGGDFGGDGGSDDW